VIENTSQIRDGKNTYETNKVENSKPHKEVFDTSSETKIDGKVVEPGQQLTYSITYTNKNKTAQEVTITDNIPDFTTFVSADNGGTESGGTVTWDLGSVAAGDSVTVSFIVEVDPDTSGETIKNKARVREGENECDTNEVSNFTPVKHNPPVLKKLIGDKPKENKKFTFKFQAISSSNGDLPMPEGSNGKVKTMQAAVGTPEEFGDIVFEKPGDYYYTISEVNTGLDGYTYDKTVYNLHYAVTLEGDALVCDLTVNGEPPQTAEFVFVNQFKNPPDKPKTGDDNNLVGWLALMLLAAAGGTGLYVRRRRGDK
jgi:pilin isopeptide linkage protein/uncharacterized repeat protein (TIGR01451 family)/LPXTG-motif cell wall-anchored protein